MWRKRNVGMRAINANVMVRYLTGDDPDQSARARAAVDGGAVFASTTVLLESVWVLRSVYGFAPEEGAAARCDAMLTFDRRFIEQAQDSPVRMLEP